MINLISDTVTKPTKEMLNHMMDAPLGDDVFASDPSVNALQDYAAQLFGMEEALFCPSGTMLVLPQTSGNERCADRRGMP